MYGPNFTFLGIPPCDLADPTTYQGADVIIVGAPIDSGTSHRSGAKFGPQAIRGGDYLPHDGSRPHLALRTDGLKDLKVFDAGDLLMPGGDLVASLDPRLEQAAMDLYANELETFRKVTLPLVAPGIAGAALLAFSLSFDDFIITNFNSGTLKTFPEFIYTSAARGIPAQANVIGSAMFFLALFIVIAGQFVGKKVKVSK